MTNQHEKPHCTCCNDLAQLRAAFADAIRQEYQVGSDKKIADALRERAFEILAAHCGHSDVEAGPDEDDE